MNWCRKTQRCPCCSLHRGRLAHQHQKNACRIIIKRKKNNRPKIKGGKRKQKWQVWLLKLQKSLIAGVDDESLSPPLQNDPPPPHFLCQNEKRSKQQQKEKRRQEKRKKEVSCRPYGGKLLDGMRNSPRQRQGKQTNVISAQRHTERITSSIESWDRNSIDLK